MSECRHGVDRDLECRECEDEYERQRKTSITKQKLGEAWAPFMDGKAAKEAQQEPAPGDIRALKYRIHELEGEVLGYKRLALERDKAAAVAHVGDMDHGPFEITPTAYGYDHLKHGDMLYTPPPTQPPRSDATGVGCA